MTVAFRSIGSLSRNFNSPVTPGSPPGFQAGDILVVGAWQFAGSNPPPDLSAYGFTRKSANTFVTAIALYTKTAVGSDTMPTFQYGTSQWNAAFCAAYTGATEVLDQTSVEAGANLTSGIRIAGAGAPPTDGDIAICLAVANTSNAAAVSISNFGSFTQRGSDGTGNGRPIACFQDFIMGSATAITTGNQVTTPANSTVQTTGSVIIFLQALNAVVPVGDEAYPDNPTPQRSRRHTQEFWQVPVELLSLPQPQPIANYDLSKQLPRRLIVENLSQAVNLVNSTLVGQDAVLIPTTWDYSWDKPVLGTANQYSGQGFDASDMTQLTTYVPYQEYNWTVPPAVRQWKRDFSYSINLNLLGKDVLPPGKQATDLPLRPRRPIENLSFNSSGLSLFYFIPVKPAGAAISDLAPKAARRPIQDFVAGTPTTLLGALTVYPPFAPSVDLPPKRAAFPISERSIEFAGNSLLRGQDVLPFGLQSDYKHIRLTYRASIYTIAEASQFLIPVGPIITGGVRHMGRVILDPVKVGEAIEIPFDFISGLAIGETLVSASVTARLYSGTDNSPQSIVTGAAQAAGTIALQVITPQIVGNIYALDCTALTTLDEALSLSAYLAIVPDVP